MPEPLSPRKHRLCTPELAVSAIVRVCQVLQPPVALATVKRPTSLPPLLSSRTEKTPPTLAAAILKSRLVTPAMSTPPKQNQVPTSKNPSVVLLFSSCGLGVDLLERASAWIVSPARYCAVAASETSPFVSDSSPPLQAVRPTSSKTHATTTRRVTLTIARAFI